MSQNLHYKVYITGTVQGVFYRASAQRKALNLGLTGFVKNESDRSVYIEVEGPEEAIEKFIQWCRRGPELAQVEDIQVNTGNLQAFTTFEIRR